MHISPTQSSIATTNSTAEKCLMTGANVQNVFYLTFYIFEENNKTLQYIKYLFLSVISNLFANEHVFIL